MSELEIWVVVKDNEMESHENFAAAAKQFANLSEFVISKSIIARLSFDPEKREWKIEEAMLEDVAKQMLEE